MNRSFALARYIGKARRMHGYSPILRSLRLGAAMIAPADDAIDLQRSVYSLIVDHLKTGAGAETLSRVMRSDESSG